MPRYIIKIRDEKFKTDYYMEWSSVVDAPVTYGMNLSEFKEYYMSQYGKYSYLALEERLKRVEMKGTSSLLESSAKDHYEYNRAGTNETRLTKEGILNTFCRVE